MGYIRKPLKKAIWDTLGLHAAVTVCLRFLSFLDGARVARCLLLSTGSHHVRLAGAYALSFDHLDQHEKPVLIQDHKMKWLDFGIIPDEGNLSPHPGVVWMKAGYSESIEWLTKQRNVDLTTDGLWAMPLNSGSVGRAAGCRIGKS